MQLEVLSWKRERSKGEIPSSSPFSSPFCPHTFTHCLLGLEKRAQVNMQIKTFTNLFLGSGLATEKCSGVILSQPCVPFTPTLRDADPCLSHLSCHAHTPGSAGLVGPGPAVHRLHPFLVTTYRRIIWETCPKCRFRGPSHQELGIAIAGCAAQESGAAWSLDIFEKNHCNRYGPKKWIAVLQ